MARKTQFTLQKEPGARLIPLENHTAIGKLIVSIESRVAERAVDMFDEIQQPCALEVGDGEFVIQGIHIQAGFVEGPM